MKNKSKKKTVPSLAERIFNVGQRACAREFSHAYYPWSEATATNRVGCMAIARAIRAGKLKP